MSVYTDVTNRITSHLEHNHVPWVRPWSWSAGRNTPCNAVSNRAYSGINTLLLWTSAMHGFKYPRFLTYRQATKVGGYVRKGEGGFTIYFVKQIHKSDPDSDDDSETARPRSGTMLRAYTVFNVEQCDGLPDDIIAPEPPKVINKDRRLELADLFLESTKADIREGAGEAYYNPASDYISLPGWSQFHGSDPFYNIAFHELTHWTGHHSRLNRNLKNRFGSQQYAAEELVAELGAAFLSAEFGFDTTVRSAGYIKSWIQLLQDDNRAIFTASSLAAKAADHLRQLALQDTDIPEPAEWQSNPIPTQPQPTDLSLS
jgi:antirestriction protein ArdC